VVRPVSVADLVLSRADDDAPGLVFEEASWTWREVVREMVVRAALLDGLRTDGPFHVGVLLENVPEFVFLIGGAALAGATLVGINPTRRGAELAADVRHTDCQAVLTDSEQSELLVGLDLGAATGHVLQIDGPRYVLDHRASAPSHVPAPDTQYLLLFTSGSTGAPKAVRVTQGRAARTVAASVFTPDDVLYCAMPLFHGNSLFGNLFPAIGKGACVVLKRRFSASEFLPDIQRYGCTFFNCVGRALSYILAVPESPEEHLTKLKWVLGPESSQRDIREFKRRFGCPVIEGYGSSENAVVIQPAPGMPKGALGRPSHGADVAIIDVASGLECPPARLDDAGRLLNAAEAIGEIVGRNTVGNFEGYYNNAEAEAERTRGGWYWSGDLGYRDTEGWFWFAGRTSDWLRVDGENFAAAPVERILARLPGVAGVAVYAVPDPLMADQVMAAMQLDPGRELDPVELDTFLGAQADLGTKWAPRFVRIVAELPTTGNGKVDKRPLRAERWETADAVWWRPARGQPYRRLTDADADALRAEFESHGRTSLLT
jgi:fatty-acyl-CoA synthase